jgi:peptidoglycan/LPS O-acetylase OafA/YrhL
MSIETFGIQRDVTRVGIDKVENIQALRGIAILMVMFYHIDTYEKFMFHRAVLSPVFSRGFTGVDLFFVISGFVMLTITKGRSEGMGRALTFLMRRVTRIYPLYLK